MKASELVAALQAAIAEHGDLPVTVLCDDGFRTGEVGAINTIGHPRPTEFWLDEATYVPPPSRA